MEGEEVNARKASVDKRASHPFLNQNATRVRDMERDAKMIVTTVLSQPSRILHPIHRKRSDKEVEHWADSLIRLDPKRDKFTQATADSGDTESWWVLVAAMDSTRCTARERNFITQAWREAVLRDFWAGVEYWMQF